MSGRCDLTILSDRPVLTALITLSRGSIKHQNHERTPAPHELLHFLRTVLVEACGHSVGMANVVCPQTAKKLTDTKSRPQYETV